MSVDPEGGVRPPAEREAMTDLRDAPPDPYLICPRCGADVWTHACKVVCPRCHCVVSTCSDLPY